MISAYIRPNFPAWRERARELLAMGVLPQEVDWIDEGEENSLFELAPEFSQPTEPLPIGAAKVSPEFLKLAETVSAHTDPQRWAVLYRLLWRMTRGGERHLLSIPSDADVHQALMWEKAIRRDIHKMHAFVRFRLIGTDAETGREQFVAWFEPLHTITRLAAPFFVKRFANMDWSILTPDECAHWSGDQLFFTPGLTRDAAPDEDELDSLWRTYYANIFNPARLKIKAMQKEMPKKYWRNLPEAELIPGLIAGGGERVKKMMEQKSDTDIPVCEE